MGCCGSKSRTVDIMTATYGATLRMLELQGKAATFVKLFERFDEDQSGTIDLVELLDIIDMERTPFVRRAFKTFDADGSGQLDFREMVFSVWNLCTMDSQGLLMLMFDLYDKDASGTMTADELEAMLKDVFHANKTSAVVKRLTGKLRAPKYGGRMSKAQFVSFGQGNSQLLIPALEAQTATRTAFLSEGFWKDRTRKRLAKKDGKWHPAQWTKLRSQLMTQDIEQRSRAARERRGEAAA